MWTQYDFEFIFQLRLLVLPMSVDLVRVRRGVERAPLHPPPGENAAGYDAAGVIAAGVIDAGEKATATHAQCLLKP